MVRRPPWLAAVVLALLVPVPARSDIIFRVPEVLVHHASAHKSVGTGPSPAAEVKVTKANDSKTTEDGLLEVTYAEYFVEHDVSTADARKAARELNLEDVPTTRVGCGTCSRKELDYCETRLIFDHCCCERRFVPEPFPWLPHTCYMGADRCRPLAHDCARYARLRDCCCYHKLAEKWKTILSDATTAPVGVSGVSLLLLSMLLFVAYL